MTTRQQIMASRRLALGVSRYHVWPTLQRQTVADHTCHVLRIYAEIFGPPDPETTMYILEHDMEELHTGDIPFPVKSRWPEVARALEPAESSARVQLSIPRRQVMEEIRLRVKVCDLLEMYEFGQVEVAMGNHLADPIVSGTAAAALSVAEEISVQTKLTIQRRLDSGRY